MGALGAGFMPAKPVFSQTKVCGYQCGLRKIFPKPLGELNDPGFFDPKHDKPENYILPLDEINFLLCMSAPKPDNCTATGIPIRLP